jgi:hypothetical protein
MMIKRAITRVFAPLAVPLTMCAVLASTAGAASAASADAPPSVYSADIAWVNYDGTCSAKAHVDYYPGSDTAYIQTIVKDPYLFVACRVHTQVWVQTRNNVYAGAIQGAMACSVLDPKCASTQTYTGTFSGQTPGLTAYVDGVNATLIDLGLPPTFTRTSATTGIRVSFSKA